MATWGRLPGYRLRRCQMWQKYELSAKMRIGGFFAA
jgi:hypothetical protein